MTAYLALQLETLEYKRHPELVIMPCATGILQFGRFKHRKPTVPSTHVVEKVKARLKSGV